MTSRDLFGYIENGKFLVGWKHHYMSRNARERFFSRHKLQNGRAVA